MPLELFSEVSDAKPRCGLCRAWLGDDDLNLSDFWSIYSEQDWFGLEDEWCSSCIKHRYALENPDYMKSGFEPDTYVVWQFGLKNGVDLSSKLGSLEASKIIRCFCFQGDLCEALKWFGCDWPADEWTLWREVFDEFDEARMWREVGFRPSTDNLESIKDWIEWECGPGVAGEYLAQGINCPPELEFKRRGRTIDEAVSFLTAGLEFMADNALDSVEVWLDVDLPWNELLLLRAQLAENQEEFESLHWQRVVAPAEMEYGCWEFLGIMFSRLRESGLPLTFENLKVFWGLNTKDILRSIDSSLGTNEAVELIRRGIPLSRATFFERALQCGVSVELARFFTRRGMTLRELRQVEVMKDVPGILRGMEKLLRADSQLSVSAALAWFTHGNFIYVKADWIALGLPPEKALLWDAKRIPPEEARKWIAAGVKNPDVATRRRDSGIRP
jgi:hypothetical protein